MAAPYRKNSMMAMLDAQPEGKGIGKMGIGQDAHSIGQQLDWSDASDNQSPLRKHLISTYLQVSDEEAMPLLGEYFGVALSFVALGALVRASNSSKRKHKKVIASDEERLDLRACSKFERMALESMLKESMERLGNLSLNAYQLESRVRDLVDESVAGDKEKVQVLNRLADAEKLVVELRMLRKAEGRANERVMSIVAAKEQDWLKEKRNLQKEIQKLKETVNGMTREAKFQARRCRNPTCEHCKRMDRVVRNVNGRISLRELHGLREASQAPVKRGASPSQVNSLVDALNVVERQEIEENRVLTRALELKKKQRDLSKVEELQPAGEIANGSGQSAFKELLVKQDMESELVNILKRVGMLKQKSHIGAGPSLSKDATETQVFMDSNDDVVRHKKDGIAPKRNEGNVKVQTEPNMHDPTLEEAVDCVSQDELDRMEFEKAFELTDDQDESAIAEENHMVATKEQEDALDVDEELLALEESFSLRDGLVRPEVGSESNEGLEESARNLVADVSAIGNPTELVVQGEIASLSQVLEEADSQEEEQTPDVTTYMVHTGTDMDEVDSQSDRLLDVFSPDLEDINVAEKPAENANEDEQVLGVIEDEDEEEDAAEFSDASSSPLDPVPCANPEQRDPSGGSVAEQPEQDRTDYDRTGVEENWGFKEPVSSAEGELLENEEIPVFERNNVDDDLAGELPELEEKRVCVPPETLDSSDALSEDEFSSSVNEETSLQEGESLKDRDSATTVEKVSSQQEEGSFVEEIGLAAADAKPRLDAVRADSQDYLEPADSVS